MIKIEKEEFIENLVKNWPDNMSFNDMEIHARSMYESEGLFCFIGAGLTSSQRKALSSRGLNCASVVHLEGVETFDTYFLNLLQFLYDKGRFGTLLSEVDEHFGLALEYPKERHEKESW